MIAACLIFITFQVKLFSSQLVPQYVARVFMMTLYWILSNHKILSYKSLDQHL